ncbi:carboxylic acid reductase [Streptomyces sp. NPDC001068]|uniref:carboxylic acid reductase n=1 Tax=Streptomyces sp. NPDC001068 TaxID=3364544 RepID=UPI00369662B1
MVRGSGEPAGDDGGTTDLREERRAAQLCAGDEQLREVQPLDWVTEAIQRPGQSMASMTAMVMDAYADRPALGERARETVTDPTGGRPETRLLPRFDMITYRELGDRLEAVAAEWHHDGHDPVTQGDFVCVLGSTSAEQAVIDLACSRLAAVCVPLQGSTSVAGLSPIVAETGPHLLAVDIDVLDSAVDLALDSPTVARVVVFDHRPDDDDERTRIEDARRRLAQAGRRISLDLLDDVIERGRGLPAAPMPEPDPDRLGLLVYTSGSTGTPKGAEYTERLVCRQWQSWFEASDRPVVTVNYMPLSHLFGRTGLFTTMARGGINYFVARGDLSTLFEDIGLARPTELLLVPRVCEMLHQRFRSAMGEAGDVDEEGRTEEIKAELREEFLGGRVMWAAVGSAPLSAEMREFVESVLDLPVHDGYGSTEAGPITVDHKVGRPPVLEYKLVDVPELGYRLTDMPFPRGELLVRSETLIPGYYRRPDVTADVFDSDGFYHTGDVMAEVGPDELVYVDRRKNVLKLAQGEFVALSRVEATFATDPLVRQIFVYGNSERSYLLAVIVPVEDATGADGDLVARLHESLRRTAAEAGLNGYEIPRDFLIETEPFSTENGLLSHTRKLIRPRLTSQYGPRLEQLYTELADRESAALSELRHGGADRPVLDTVLQAAGAVLGGQDLVDPDARFGDLGGDSLSALTLSELLGQIFGFEVSVGVIISPANNLRKVAEHIESERDSGSRRPTFATVHGPGGNQVEAADLTLARFIDPRTLAAAPTLPLPEAHVHTVLMTGANGYLGRFMALDQMEHLAPIGGRLICVVRGADAEAAWQRLESVYDSDPELLARFRELARGHLEVLAGDIGEAGLGLDETTWQRLADTVDHIAHPAALVNHVLPYEQLFGPNVVGTAELIRLAITGRMKPITFLSTVAALVGPLSSAEEDADIRTVSPVRALGDDYANGYATSKWAGEVLLREAHDLCGLPVSVFRSDLILAHSRYVGQVNVPDVFTRLLFSVIATGVAPDSFYRLDAQGHRRPAHYNGLPVDFTAEAVNILGGRVTRGYRTYNVFNPHADGISLDTFVDWLVEAGYSITRVHDFDEWFARFETAIRAMPDQQKQYSLLPLLQAFSRPAEAVNGAGFPTERFEEAVRAAGVGPDKDVPHLGRELICKYPEDLRALGILPGR